MSRVPWYPTRVAITTETDGTVAVRYHRTDVATLHPDGSVTLRTGGWRTVTAKRRMNQALVYFGIPAIWASEDARGVGRA